MDLVAVQSESYKTKFMARHIVKVVQSIGGCTISYDSYKNIYVTKGKAKLYNCMVCHIDTVHSIVPSKIVPINVNGNIIAINNNTLEQIGTGGDDKVGIHITIELLKKLDNFKAVFFLDEEVGCIGSGQADYKFFDDCKYVLECDRRGNSDFVHRISSTELCSKKFINDLRPILNQYGYSECSGGMTDVLEIAYETNLCVANISCGYYNPHTDTEYINIEDVINTFNMCYDIFTKINNKYTYDGVRTSYSYGNYHYGNIKYHDYPFDKYGNVKYEEEYYEEEIDFDSQSPSCGIGCFMQKGYCSQCMITDQELKDYYEA